MQVYKRVFDFNPIDGKPSFNAVMSIHHDNVYAFMYLFHPDSICYNSKIFKEVSRYYLSSNLMPTQMKYKGDEISFEYTNEIHSFAQLREKIIDKIPNIDEYIKLYAKDKEIDSCYNLILERNNIIQPSITLDNLILERNNIIQPSIVEPNEYIDIDDAMKGESFVPYDENYISSHGNYSLTNVDQISFVESYDPSEDTINMFHRMTFEREHIDLNDIINENDYKSIITIDNVSMLSNTYDYIQFCNIVHACVSAM
jgi:hypothetical protein